MKYHTAFLAASLVTASLLAPLAATHATDAVPIELADVFTDHMVLQRGEPIKVWGTANPGSKLSVRFATHTSHVVSDQNGAWSVSIPAMSAGGPYELTVSGASATTLKVRDVLIGDVWLCSGQSNMEMPVSRVRSSAAELRRKHSSTIRLLSIERDLAHAPQAGFTNKPAWAVADAESVADFSALCYFFGREVQKDDPTALGLIDSSWGGAQLEAWVAADYLRPAGDYGESLDILDLHAVDPKAAMQRLGRQWETWRKTESGDTEPLWQKDPATDSDWSPVPKVGDWKAYGDPEFENYDGMAWYRHAFDLSDAQAADGVVLSLGHVQKSDVVWINGQFVGRGYGWSKVRSYALPPDVLRTGTNHVLVNIRSMWWQGGLVGPEADMGVTLANGERIALADGWQYRKDSTKNIFPPPIPWESVFGLTGMYNAMIAPLDGIRLKGAIWYQGESNTRRAWLYGDTLNALIENWRAVFGADIPFLVIQLPEFGRRYPQPVESDWSNLREQQRRVAVDDANTGLVVGMGLGDPTDIHPTNKQDLAKRAVRVWRELGSGASASTLGFSPYRAYASGAGTVVEFTPPDDGFVVHNAGQPIAFELCGGEPLRCVFADAVLTDTVVTLTSDRSTTNGMHQPAIVRYCWGNSPICNLFTEDGSPVGPFEIAVER